MRIAALIAGALLIGAATLGSIMSTGGFVGYLWPMQVALAIALVVAAGSVGIAWSESRYVLAAALLIGLIASEAYALFMTGERVIAQRDAVHEPVTRSQSEQATAKAALDAAIAAVPTSSKRLETAEAAVSAANAAVAGSAAERSCAANCRTLLEQQVTNALTERAAARSALDSERSHALAAVSIARQTLANIKPAVAPAGLAARLGVSQSTLDLIAAALASVGINGLGTALVAFGTHRRREASVEVTAKPIAPDAAPKSQRQAVATPARALPRPQFDGPTARHQAARFIDAAMIPDDRSGIPFGDLKAAMQAWLSTTGEAAHPELVLEFGHLLNDLGLRQSDGILHGARLKAHRELA